MISVSCNEISINENINAIRLEPVTILVYLNEGFDELNVFFIQVTTVVNFVKDPVNHF